MKRMAQVIGRLLAVLVDKGVIDGKEAQFILFPLQDVHGDD